MLTGVDKSGDIGHHSTRFKAWKEPVSTGISFRGFLSRFGRRRGPATSHGGSAISTTGDGCERAIERTRTDSGCSSPPYRALGIDQVDGEAVEREADGGGKRARVELQAATLGSSAVARVGEKD